MKRHLPWAAVLALLFAASPALAQLPAARISAVFPPGGKIDSSFTVTLTGEDLDGASALTFSHPGITAKKAGDAEQKKATFTVTIGSDVPPGTYDCRVAGRFGISNPRAFVAADQDHSHDALPGKSPADAGKLSVNTSVAGRCSASAFDFWSFEAKKGQRLMVECLTREIDSRLSPSLAIDDAAGREVGRSRRTGFVDFTAPEDGVYTVRLSDMLYRGGDDFVYRLCVSTAPRIDHVFPPAGVPGARGKFTVVGRNLPGGKKSDLVAADGRPLEELEVEIEVPKDPPVGQQLTSAGVVSPAAVGLEGFAYRLKSDYGSSNAVPILFAAGDVTAEAAKNDSPAEAQELSPPARVAGRFYPRNDRDYYAVEAKKGDEYYIEITSNRLDLPTAPLVVVQRVTKGDGAEGGEKVADVLTSPEDETNVGTPAFRTGTRDFAIRWEVKDDGEYRILVRDRFSVSQDNASLVYLLSVRKATPDVQLAVTPISAAPTETAVWNPTLRRGGVAPLRVTLFRQDGFDGEVTVSADDLPAGVSCDPITLKGGQSDGILMLAAADDAEPAAGPFRVTARAKVGDEEVTREARGGTVVLGTTGDGRGNANSVIDPVVARLSRDLTVAVCDEAEPVVITADAGKPLEVKPGEKLTIELKAKKNADVKSALKLKPAGLDALRNVKEINFDVNKSDSAKLEIDTKQARLAPGTYTFYLAGPGQVKYKRPADEAAAKADDKDDKKKGNDKDKKNELKDVNTVVLSGPITITVLPEEKKDDKKGKK